MAHDKNEVPDQTGCNVIKFYRPYESYGFLSNFAECNFRVRGVLYRTVENYYQSMKFTQTPFIKQQIIDCRTPREAYMLAKAFAQKIDSDWIHRRETVMVEALKHKFHIRKFADALLSTGNAELIENNPHDSFWGCGKDGCGLNRNGTLLMRRRNQIRQERAAVEYEFLARDLNVDFYHNYLDLDSNDDIVPASSC